MAEQGAHAVVGQVEVGVEGEFPPVRATIEPHLDADAAHRRVLLTDCGYSVYSTSSTTNENTSMPPASQWACAYSIASTWS